MRLLAVDLGSSGGKLFLGTLSTGDSGSRLDLEEVHRFHHGPVYIPHDRERRLHWDAIHLWSELLNGIRRTLRSHGVPDSIGVDTWGDDFALLDSNGELLGNPVCYRDARTLGMIERAERMVGREEIFNRTGMQFMTPNALYHLMGMMAQGSPLPAMADGLLMMPDLMHYWLCGSKSGEYTNASITQMLNCSTRDWDRELLRRLDVPNGFLPPIAEPGARLGTVRPSVAEETGLPASLPIICPATHDTASAVVATPGEGQDWAFLSAGTWCLFGAEVDRPYLTAAVMGTGFGNEGGVRGTIRLLRNITGLWLVQECRRAWSDEGRDLDYAELASLASEARPFVSFIDPDHESFSQPTHMPHAIAEYCRLTNQTPPESVGEFVRVALEGIALTVRRRWVQLEALLGRELRVLHIVGGGSQNRLLCQLISDAIGRPVLTGPVEATAMGNALVQAVGHGALDYDEARAVVRRSVHLEEFLPRSPASWDEAFGRFTRTLASPPG